MEREGATFSYRTLHRGLNRLQDAGLVEQLSGDRSYYGITEKGRAYLAGDLDADDLE